MKDYKKFLRKINKEGIIEQTMQRKNIIKAWDQLLKDVVKGEIDKQEFEELMSGMVIFTEMFYDLIKINGGKTK